MILGLIILVTSLSKIRSPQKVSKEAAKLKPVSIIMELES